MNLSYLRTAGVVLVFAAIAPMASAQVPVGSDGVWMTFGAGASTPSSLHLNMTYNFASDQSAYQVGFDYGGFLLWGEPKTYKIVLNGALGQRTHSRYFLLAQFVGPSLIYRVNREQEARRSLSPGLAANAQFHAKPLGFFLPEVGVGMELFGNLNFVESFYGFRLSVLFHNTL